MERRRCAATGALSRHRRASGEEGSGRPLETAAHERDNGLRRQQNKDAGHFSGLEHHRRRRQRGRCAARGTCAARCFRELRFFRSIGVRLVCVAMAGGVRGVRMAGMRHRVRVAIKRMRRGLLMPMHALCVRMHDGRTVRCSTADHGCGSETLDGNRQGQKPHHHDPQNSRHPESLEHRAASSHNEGLDGPGMPPRKSGGTLGLCVPRPSLRTMFSGTQGT